MIITLTTDFGTSDEYVGVMKGVILARAPQVRLVDLTHQVPPQDVDRAAEILAAAFPYFPAGTIHLAVVDPGVGSDRDIVLVAAGGQLFLAPDNGLLTPLLARDIFESARAVRCEHLFLEPLSHTFHGRDIMAPVAAALAHGMNPEEVGPRLSGDELISRARPEPRLDPAEKKLAGMITGSDRFGNLTTNITAADLAGLIPGDYDRSELTVTVRDTPIKGLVTAYARAEPGRLLCLINSRGFLEIAAREASAATILAAGPGVRVLVTRRSAGNG
ncbi:MAG: SAM-dependent chlorinase/fluorinase [Desulfobacterales bacterium]|nr:SAM-dependent chlorinase/fluorinase [Desulfobacterales bacterium]